MTTTPTAQPRVVLVTGGSSGIGRAAAQQLSRRGDHVVIAARGATALRAAEQECRAAGARSVASHRLDVRDAGAVQGVVDEIVDRHGRIDAVLQSAGVVAYGRFEEVPAEVFDAVMATNVLGTANVARSALRVMRAQRHGVLVIVGSVLGEVAVPTMSPYVVSKWALRGLGRELALENRDLPDVRVCVLSPGGVDTPIYRQAANYLGRPGRPPAPVQSAGAVARNALRLIDHPRDRAESGPANYVMRLGFSLAPRVFDAVVGPLFSAAALARERIPATDGNVHDPQDDLEAVDAGQGQGLVSTVRSLVDQARGAGVGSAAESHHGPGHRG